MRGTGHRREHRKRDRPALVDALKAGVQSVMWRVLGHSQRSCRSTDSRIRRTRGPRLDRRARSPRITRLRTAVAVCLGRRRGRRHLSRRRCAVPTPTPRPLLSPHDRFYVALTNDRPATLTGLSQLAGCDRPANGRYAPPHRAPTCRSRSRCNGLGGGHYGALLGGVPGWRGCAWSYLEALASGSGGCELLVAPCIPAVYTRDG
jgi:hypothetical protein